MNINKHVSLATAERSKQWFEDFEKTPLRKRAGGRVGTIDGCTLEQFAKRVGPPHQQAPPEDWRDYDKPLIHGDGKISAQWKFDTPRGLVEVSDYWWNRPDELSVRACDRRAVIWFRRWCRHNDFSFC